jgi:hypothetical protein
MLMIQNEIDTQLLRLPPRSRLRDWIWAGASAGLLVGMAEFLVAYPAGVLIPVRLAICLLVVNAAISCAGAALIGWILDIRRMRVSRSGLVGAVIGPQLLISIIGGLSISLDWGESGLLQNLAGLGLAAGLAIVAGGAAFRITDGLERRGIVVSAPLVWGGVALMLAGCERLFLAENISADFSLLGVIAALLAIGVAAWKWGESVAPRANSTARPFGWLLGWLAVAALGLTLAPVATPWILFDSNTPAREEGPPNLLIIAIPAVAENTAAATTAIMPTFEGLGLAGRRYQLEGAQPHAAVRALLADAEGNALAPQLTATGYLTAAIFPSEEILPELVDSKIDVGRGGLGLLEGPLGWLAVAPLLKGPAAVLLSALEINTRHRSAEQVAWQARRWLLEWRSEEAAAPFLLFVDLRGESPVSREDSIAKRCDAILSGLLKDLEMLDAARSTLVVVLRVPAEADDGFVQVVMHGAEHWLPPTISRDLERVRARTLGQFLLTTRGIDLLPSDGG